jgi:hypothetical protein
MVMVVAVVVVVVVAAAAAIAVIFYLGEEFSTYLPNMTSDLFDTGGN